MPSTNRQCLQRSEGKAMLVLPALLHSLLVSTSTLQFLPLLGAQLPQSSFTEGRPVTFQASNTRLGPLRWPAQCPRQLLGSRSHQQADSRVELLTLYNDTLIQYISFIIYICYISFGFLGNLTMLYLHMLTFVFLDNLAFGVVVWSQGRAQPIPCHKSRVNGCLFFLPFHALWTVHVQEAAPP